MLTVMGYSIISRSLSATPICRQQSAKHIKQRLKIDTSSKIPEILQISVQVLILQQLALNKVVAQAELWHGQYLSFVRRGVTGGAHQVIPVLSTGDALTEHQEIRNSS